MFVYRLQIESGYNYYWERKIWKFLIQMNFTLRYNPTTKCLHQGNMST